MQPRNNGDRPRFISQINGGLTLVFFLFSSCFLTHNKPLNIVLRAGTLALPSPH